MTGKVDLGLVSGPLVFSGLDTVTSSLVGRWGSNATLVSLRVDGQPAVLGFREHELTALLRLSNMGDHPGNRIVKVHVVADPAKLLVPRSELQCLAIAR